jgi:4-hydroxythreonine-4-phosphate dehydrogenase
LARAAKLRAVPSDKLEAFVPGAPLNKRKIYVHQVGPELGPNRIKAGKPNSLAGQAQLAYIDAAYDLVRGQAGMALVTGPVSKLAIARSGSTRARRFRGHTEWLQARDGAPTSVMCFAARQLITSLVTTHLPLAKVPKALDSASVCEAIVQLAKLARQVTGRQVVLAVCSLNPHAGEGELFGVEESRAIVPGMRSARRRVGKLARLVGPIGAETAYRKAVAGAFDGVVAMYHDQATIPMKLVAFGDAVNVTMGLSIVRTSVDHGTGYDIAWRGIADEQGMLSAMRLGAKLVG